ncbi:MAG: DUF3710 domain-containing protein [Geodermatophilaceae bacterium]|nr:DUF3710 domain-containing protein [Geodermatophilaceae bacterium]
MPFGKRRRLDRSVRAKGVAPEPELRERTQPSTSGPYDVADAPEDTMVRIDLGALRLPAPRGGDLRLDVNKAGAIISATLRLNGSAMQVGVFAAPRHEGIWREVRAEILETLGRQGGTGTERKGRFGTELEARLAMKQGPQPARFLGVDGPRWFVRALITGPAASEAEQAKPLEDVFGQLVVVRGTDPMPVREAIPLQLPADPNAAKADEAETTAD